MSELRARDVLRDLPPRRVVGDRLSSRVGARAFAPPPFAKGRRIFERFGIPDPWDPDAPQVSLELGDVGLSGRKLPAAADPNRRMPAPHAAPPAAKAPAARPGGLPPGFKPPAVADAPRAGKPAPRIGDTRPDDSAAARKKAQEAPRRKVSEQSMERTRVNQPVRSVPLRPDAAGGGVPPGATAGTPVALPRPAATAPAAVPRPPGPRPPNRAGGAMPPRVGMPPRPASSGPIELPLPPEPDLDEPAGPGDLGFARRPLRGPEPASAPPPSLSPPPPSAPPPSLSPPPPSPSPPRPPPMPVALSPEAPSAPAPARPVPGRAPPRPGGGNLDDLFGMGGGENTRIRMGGASEEARPRRPRVVDPSEAPGGVDRRPPPPRPPSVTPSTPSPAGAPRGGTGDEEPPE